MAKTTKTDYLIIDGKTTYVDLYTIYMIKSDDKIKVGVTRNLNNRFYQINAYRFDCELLYNTDYIINGYEVEAKIHNALKSIRAMGREWYYYKDCNKIKSVILDMIEKYGKLASNYEKATSEQIAQYKLESEKNMEKWLKSMTELCNTKTKDENALNALCKSISKYIMQSVKYDTNVYIYNGKFYINPWIVINTIDESSINPDYYYDDPWIEDIINDYSYVKYRDYLIISGCYYLSIEAVCEICMLINNYKSICIRVELTTIKDFYMGVYGDAIYSSSYKLGKIVGNEEGIYNHFEIDGTSYSTILDFVNNFYPDTSYEKAAELNKIAVELTKEEGFMIGGIKDCGFGDLYYLPDYILDKVFTEYYENVS